MAPRPFWVHSQAELTVPSIKAVLLLDTDALVTQNVDIYPSVDFKVGIAHRRHIARVCFVYVIERYFRHWILLRTREDAHGKAFESITARKTMSTHINPSSIGGFRWKDEFYF